MSVVTSVVVACPWTWTEERAEHLGHVVLLKYRADRSWKIEPNDGFEPLSDDYSGGSKYPSGYLFWLGLNHARMDELLAALDADPQCHGAWIWYQGEFSRPSTHLVGVREAS
jgi:hypothetical protein